MKINLLFHSFSITKVISTACLLILIISGAHIVNVIGVLNDQTNHYESIERLVNLKHTANTLIIESKYTRNGMIDSLSKLIPLVHVEPLENMFFNVDNINQSNLQLQRDLSVLQEHIYDFSDTQLRQHLKHFSGLIALTTEHYQRLLKDEYFLINTVDILAFLLIALCSLFLLIYCRKHIVQPLKELENNVTSITNHEFNVNFPEHENEVGILSTGMKSMSVELEYLITEMQIKVFDKTVELEKVNERIQFLYTISQQLSTVKLTPEVILEALNALAKQTNLSLLCLELVNGKQIDSELGCAVNHQAMKRIPIIINGKPYGYLNYVQPFLVAEDASIIVSFSSLLARALYQDEYSLQEQKLLLMEERGVIARELHDSIAQALSFLKIQCVVLRRQIELSGNDQNSKESVNNIEEAVSEAYVQLRSLLSTFRLNISVSDFKEAVLIMILQLQKQTTAKIQLGKFASNFQTHANQHIHLLQIVREAITNAMKHAQCNNITINCVTMNQHVVITICDDGIGIERDPSKENHYGIEIMHQRAIELNAILKIQNLSVGTEIKIIFPI